MSSGDTTLTLSSSNLNHSSNGQRPHEKEDTSCSWLIYNLDGLQAECAAPWSHCGYLLSSWPSPRSDLRSWSGLGAWAQPAGRSSHCCWSQCLQEKQTFLQFWLTTNQSNQLNLGIGKNSVFKCHHAARHQKWDAQDFQTEFFSRD